MEEMDEIALSIYGIYMVTVTILEKVATRDTLRPAVDLNLHKQKNDHVFGLVSHEMLVPEKGKTSVSMYYFEQCNSKSAPPPQKK